MWRWHEFCISVGDTLFGWLLYLPRDVSLMLLAVVTTMVLLLIRRLVANQLTLQFTVQDDRRLRRLIHRARRRGDRQRAQSYRQTRASVARKRLAAEFWPAVFTLLPLGIMVTWAADRMAYYPPASGAPIELVVYTPVTAVGDVVHLVPRPEVQLSGGWMREIELSERVGRPRGLASWDVCLPPPPTDVPLQLRFGATTIQHRLRVGHVTYAPPVTVHGADLITTNSLEPYRPFSFIRGTSWLPAWSVAYFLLSATFFFAGKYAFRIR